MKDSSLSAYEHLQQELSSAHVKIKQLEAQLVKKEAENKKLRDNTASLQAHVEEEEECITNTLLKRLDALKREKEALALQVESEEEFMTNTLQKKLDGLRKEKIELENHLETEQEYIVNKLQKQLLELTRQKSALERRLNEGRSGLISKLEQSVGDLKDSFHEAPYVPPHPKTDEEAS